LTIENYTIYSVVGQVVMQAPFNSPLRRRKFPLSMGQRDVGNYN